MGGLPVSNDKLEFDLGDLTSAEDFLDHFGIEYEPRIVAVHRLHILQRFHDYLEKVGVTPEEEGARFEVHAHLLKTAYQDFVDSTAAAEKVFKVFRSEDASRSFVPLSHLLRRGDREDP